MTAILEVRKIRNMKTLHRSRTRVRRDRVSATEAAKNFGGLVDRVRDTRVTYVVERGGSPVAQIGPVDQETFTMAGFRALVESAPRLDEKYLVEVEQAVERHTRPRARRNPWAP